MAMSWMHIALVFFALACSIGLNGCSVDVPKHKYGFWQGKLNYLTKFQYYYEGLPAKKAILNSCSDRRIPPSMVCGGHGRCRSWNDLLPGQSPGTAGKLVAFCECNKRWADPECRTQRKSQSVAYFLSLFLGFSGADQFYLGFWTYGWTKLFSLGGFGIWYMFDVVRIGSYPVSTIDSFRVAPDLPHYVFVVSSFSVMLTLGFSIGLTAINHERKSKAHEMVLIRKDEEDVVDEIEDEIQRGSTKQQMPVQVVDEPMGAFSGYGATLDASQSPAATMGSMLGTGPPGTGPPSQRYSARPGSMAIPSTLPPSSIQALSRSFRPAQTLPPQAVQTLPSMGLSPLAASRVSQAPVGTATLPAARLATGTPIPSNSVLTEYSVPRAVSTVPMTDNLGMTNLTTNIATIM